MDGMISISAHEMVPQRMQESLYSDIFMPDEVIAIRREVRQFADQELAPVAWAIGHHEESIEHFPHELFKNSISR